MDLSRRPLKYNTKMTIKIEHDNKVKLEQMARINNMKVSELIRTLLQKPIDNFSNQTTIMNMQGTD